jgi:saccharopine dehydrogenase-like NADP-dependent oxidoreductase
MDELDTVDRVYTAWRIGGLAMPPAEGPDPEPNAAAVHWIHNCTEPIKTWRDGQLTDAYALEEFTLTYPGIGEGSVWVCGHPEPLTLPRVRPEIKDSFNVMTSRRGLMDALQRVAGRVRSGEFDVTAAAKQILHEPDIRGAAAGPSPIFPNLFAVAEGTKDGKPARAAAQPIVLPNENMGEMTGYPLAIAALMMARGEVDRPGVHGPEGAIDPKVYFDDLAQLVEDHPAGAQIVEVVSELI